MSNTNCLQGKQCPKCGYEDEIVVYASMWVSLQDDGTDPFGNSTRNRSDVDYDETSDARCPVCNYEGKLSKWDVVAPNDKVERCTNSAYAPTPCSESGIYESQNSDQVCDTCSGQEGRHYCLVRTTQVKNMNIMTCDEWAPKIPNDQARCPSACSALADRWTDEEKEAAATIVNDISEQIDNGEGRGALRKALAIYADLLSDEVSRRNLIAAERTQKEVSELLETLKPNDNMSGDE